MLLTLTAPNLTALFLGIVICLGCALVLMIWQIEDRLQPQRKSHRR